MHAHDAAPAAGLALDLTLLPPMRDDSPASAYAAAVWRQEAAALHAIEAGHDLGLDRNGRAFKSIASLAAFVPPPFSAWTEDAVRALADKALRGKGVTGRRSTVNSAIRTGMASPRPLPASLAAPAPGVIAVPADAPKRRWTDAGNAAALVDQYGADLRYVAVMGRWLVWTGQRWTQDDRGAVTEYAKALADALYREAKRLEQEAEANNDPDARKRAKALKDHAKKSESAGKLAAIVGLAQSDPRVVVVPDDLDRAPHLLSTGAGVVDLRDGSVRAPDRGLLITRGTDVPYDPAATCPTWERFVLEVMDGDRDLAAYMQRAIGYSLTGETKEQCFFLLQGDGSNGKSTLVDVLQEIVGDYAEPTPFDTFLEQQYGRGVPNDIADLRGSRVVISAEPPEGARFAESLIKWLTGGDMVKARFLRQEFFKFRPAFKLWLLTNPLPRVLSTDDAFWRRVQRIPFNRQFQGADADRSLPAKLRAELPGVLAWAVRGAAAWYREGLAPPAAVRAAVAEYRADSDDIGGFLAEQTTSAPGSIVPVADVYKQYARWAEDGGHKHVPDVRVFARRLRSRGSVRLVKRGNVRCVEGVALRSLLSHVQAAQGEGPGKPAEG